MYRPEDMPQPVRAASPAEEGRQNALLDYYVRNIKQANFFQDGQALGSDMSEAEVQHVADAIKQIIAKGKAESRN